VQYFPSSDQAWATLDPSSAGWNPEALNAALQLAGDRGSTTVMILQGGRIIAERFWLGATPGFAMDVASAQKSVTSVLIGIAQDVGHLSVDDTVTRWLGVGWSRAHPQQESQISIRHLLSMDSGLDNNLSYSDPPETRWFYNTPAYSKLHLVLAQATGASLEEYSSQALFGPIGMSSATWTRRAAGHQNATRGAAMGLRLSARDMARFGLLVLANGMWADQHAVVSSSYVRSMLDSSQRGNPSYGWLWWLNGKPTYKLPGSNPAPIRGPIIPNAPSDLAAALGALDQKIYIVPSLDLVVTRQGRAAGPRGEGASSFDNIWWQYLMAAAPHR
jgi:CubicO group peptidase (beta-lactamase class C family)